MKPCSSYIGPDSCQVFCTSYFNNYIAAKFINLLLLAIGEQWATAIVLIPWYTSPNPSCETLKHQITILSHQSCDEANCESLTFEVKQNLTRQLPEQCHDYILVGPCTKSSVCTANPNQVEPLLTRLSFLGWDALKDDKCKEIHGNVMRGTASTCSKDEGCEEARLNAFENFKKFLGAKNEECVKYIATTPPSQCVQYGNCGQPPNLN